MENVPTYALYVDHEGDFYIHNRELSKRTTLSEAYPLKFLFELTKEGMYDMPFTWEGIFSNSCMLCEFNEVLTYEQFEEQFPEVFI